MKVDEFLSGFYKRHLRHIGGPESAKKAQNELEVVQKLTDDKEFV
ncbi:hypothetical protein ES703_86351 [subsurface metagenome]